MRSVKFHAAGCFGQKSFAKLYIFLRKSALKFTKKKQKGKLNILLFPVVLVQSKLDISTKIPAIMLE